MIIIMIQITQTKNCNIFTSLLLDVYMWLNMFRATPHPSSRPYNCAGSLVVLPLEIGVWSFVGGVLAHARPPQTTHLWNCCILLVDLFQSYDDVGTCERQNYINIYYYNFMLPSRIIVKSCNTTRWITFEAAVHTHQRIL
jgi:hypothetical protein